MLSDELKEEAKAFDARISERVKNGLVPDIRRAASIDWFYNNPWRRPEFVQMIFGDYLKFAQSHLPDEYREAKDKNEKEQSPNDNSSYATDMLEALRVHFDEVSLSHGNTLTPRLLGGVRGNPEEVSKMTSFLTVFDDFVTSEKILEPGVVYFAGKLKASI